MNLEGHLWCFKAIPQRFAKKTQRFTKNMDADKLSNIIIGLAIEVHRNLGPGLLESSYCECLSYEIRNSGLHVESQKALPIIYKDIRLEHGYRIDLLVENKLVLEPKTVECFTEVHYAQILTYLKLGNYPLGLLINFHTKTLKEGIKRFINQKAANNY